MTRPHVVRGVWILLLVAAVVAGLIGFVNKGTSELPVYTLGADRMMAGESLYRPSDDKPFTYPPFFALPFVPLTALPESAHRAVWYFVNLGALVWIVRLVRKWLRVANPPDLSSRDRVLIGVVVALLSARFIAAVFSNQSHDLLVCLAIAIGADAWNRERAVRAGACFGLAAAMKATPLLFLVLLAVQRRWSALAAMIAVGAAATLITDLIYPAADGRLWVISWIDTFVRSVEVGGAAAQQGTWRAESSLNQSLGGTLHRLTTPLQGEPGRFSANVAVADLSTTLRRGVTMAGQGAVLCGVAWAALRPARPSADTLRGVGECGAVVCGMVLLSPMSSKSHFCVLILPATYLAWRVFSDHRRSLVLVGLVAVAAILAVGSAKGLWPRKLGNELLAYGVVTWVTVAQAAATLIALKSRRLRLGLGEDSGPVD